MAYIGDSQAPLRTDPTGTTSQPVTFSGSLEVNQVSGSIYSTYITGAAASTYAEILNPDGRVKVELSTIGLTDTELRASSIPTAQVSGSIWSTSVTNTVGVSATDLDIRDLDYITDDVSIYQVSGHKWSTEATQAGTWSVTATATDLDIRDLVNATDSISAYQVSGGNWSVSVTDVFGSVGASVINPDGRLKVEMPSGASGLTDSELRASSIPVSQASGANWSVYVTDVFMTTVASNVLNADNRLKVSVETGGSSLTDSELRASSVPVAQVSGVSWSTEATQAGTWNIGTVTTVTGVTNSVAAGIVDSGGIQYSGSNPLPTYLVLGAGNSTISVGPVLHDAVDDGAAPQKVGGVAMQANPTAVAGGDIVRFIADDIGRQVMTIHQVRDLIVTARAAPTNVAPTTLLAGGGAGVFHDLISLTASNASTAANTAVGSWITFDVLDNVAGGAVLTFSVGNGNTIIYTPPAPIKQSEGGNTWQVDITSDASTLAAAPLVVTALFAKNV